MANQVTVSNNNTINVTVEPPANVQVQVSRAVIGTVANVASANLANYVTQPNQSNITSVGIMTGLTSTGNITAPFFIGNVVGNISGNLVVPGSNTAVLFNNQGNAGASDAFKFDQSSNTVTLLGNITANYYVGNGSQLTDVIAVSANYANYANIANTANSVAVANVVGIGNIAVINLDGNASNILYGNGVFGPDIGPQDVANANYANFAGDVVNSSQPNITSLGTLTGLVMAGDITPSANLTYSLGNNTNRFNDLYLSGNTIYLGAQEISANTTSISFTGILSGNANGLSSIPGGNVAGYVANATHSNVADVANSVAGANVTGYVANATHSNIADLANSVAGSNVTGQVSYAAVANSVAGANVSGAVAYATVANSVAGANVSGQVSYAATANSVAVANVVGIGNIATTNYNGNGNSVLAGNGAWVAQTGGGGSGTSISNGTSNVNIATSNGNVTVGVGGVSNIMIATNTGVNVTGYLTSTGNLTVANANLGNLATANFFSGDGGLLSNIVAANVVGNLPVRFSVKNTSGSTLNKGTPIYATGSVGVSGVIEVSPSRADTAATMGCIGMLEQDLINNAFGTAISIGQLFSMNTSTYLIGDEIYVGATGGITNVRPNDGYVVQPIGSISRVQATTGIIEVNIWDIVNLPNLNDGNIWVGTTGNGYPVQAVLSTANVGNANFAAYAGNVTVNTQPNITSTGNLVYLNVRDNSNANSVIQQFVPNSTPIWTNNPTSNSAYQVTTQYWPNASTNYPTRSIIRSRGNATTPTTAVTSDRVAQDRLLVYNGNANVLIGTQTWTLTAGGTLSSLANQAYAGGQWNILTANPAASNLANSNATDAQNQLTFTNSGAIAIVRSTPANSSLTQTTNMISTTDYGSNVNNLTQAGGILQQRIRGNRDGNLSVQPSDVIGRMLYAGYNGTSVDTTNAATITAYVDSSYTANNSIIPINISLNALSNVGGVATFKTTQFYGNGTTSFPGLITTTGNANVANLNVTGNVLPTSNITYDIGSNTYRFKDIWLANSTIHIGDQTISANSTNTIISGIITGNGSGLTNLPIATNLVVGTRTTPVTIPISNYEMNVLTRTGNVVVYVN